jgi:hypothetical protein
METASLSLTLNRVDAAAAPCGLAAQAHRASRATKDADVVPTDQYEANLVALQQPECCVRTTHEHHPPSDPGQLFESTWATVLQAGVPGDRLAREADFSSVSSN